MIEALLDQEPTRVALVTIVDASLLALVGLIGARFIRHSAGLLHKLLAATLLLVLALPLFSLVAPAWSPFPPSLGREAAISRQPAFGSHPARTFATSAESSINGNAPEAPAPMERLHWLGAIWLAGFVVMILRRVNDHRARSLILRNSTSASAELIVTCAALSRKLGIRRPMNLRLSVEATVPMTWGVMRPVLLLPASACSWDSERIGIVLLHELAHIARLDAMTRSVADAATLIHWFNPFVIGAARALRRTAEQASDDIVLREGICRRNYVDALVDLARSSRSHRLTEAVITSSELERRVTAIIDTGRAEKRDSSGFLAGVMAILFGTLVFSAGVGRSEPGPVTRDELESQPNRPAPATVPIASRLHPRGRQIESQPRRPAPAALAVLNEASAISIDDFRRTSGESEVELAPRLRRMLEAGAAPERVLAASRDLRTDAERQTLLLTILAQEPDLIPAVAGELWRFHSDAARQELIVAICSRTDLSAYLADDIVTETARLRSVAARTDTIVAIASTQVLDESHRLRLREIALQLPSGSRDRALASLH